MNRKACNDSTKMTLKKKSVKYCESFAMSLLMSNVSHIRYNILY